MALPDMPHHACGLISHHASAIPRRRAADPLRTKAAAAGGASAVGRRLCGILPAEGIGVDAPRACQSLGEELESNRGPEQGTN